MHFPTSSLLFTAIAILPSTLATGSAIVKNLCNFPVYVQSATNNNGPVSIVYTLPANGGSYSEVYKSAGSAIKMGTWPALSAPLTLEYTPSGSQLYYDLSNNAGNPFNLYHVDLTSSNPACPGYNCPASNPGCYSSANALKVKACGTVQSLTVTLCATS